MSDSELPRIVSGFPIRIILHAKETGAANMAIDEVLMDSAGRKDGRLTIRLYGFSPATVSVGRFQRTHRTIDVQALDRDGIAFVRRPTGGQAVFHDGELTYSIAIGKHHMDKPGKRNAYRMIVPLLTSCLSALGVEGAAMRGEQRGSALNPDCFASSGEYEIDGPTGEKLIGSAQAVSRTSVLQHGSIPLDASNRHIHRYFLDKEPVDHTPTNVSEVLGREVSFQMARDVFASSVKESLLAFIDGGARSGVRSGVRSVCEGNIADSSDGMFVIEELTDSEAERVRLLSDTKYANNSWNFKY